MQGSASVSPRDELLISPVVILPLGLTLLDLWSCSGSAGEEDGELVPERNLMKNEFRSLAPDLHLFSPPACSL